MSRGIPEERLRALIEGKDADAALESCEKHGYSESWSLIDGCMVIYNLDDPPRWLLPVLAAQDDDGNTPEAFMVPFAVEATDHLSRDPRFLRWLEDHGINPKDTYRIEASRVAGTVTVYQYALDGDGKHFIDQETGDIAYREPFSVPLKTWVLPTPSTSEVAD